MFLVSDMVVELVTQKGESRFHFNGTVEWALDSVESSGVVWLPREDQLRELLGGYFLSLDSSAGGYVVTVSGPGRAYHTEPEPDAADAYARAALYVLGATARLSRGRRAAGEIGAGQHRRRVRERPGAPAGQPQPAVRGADQAAERAGPDQQRPGVGGRGGADQRGEAHVAEAEPAAGDQPDRQIEQPGQGRTAGGAEQRRPACAERQRERRPAAAIATQAAG